MIVKDFIEWLTEELNKRGWSNSELARRSGLAQSTISMVISRQSNPGWEFCARVAKAFGLPVNRVFHLAGLVEAAPESVPGEEAIIHAFRNLPQARRQFLTDMLRGLSEELPFSVVRESGVAYNPQLSDGPPTPDPEDIMEALQGLDSLELQAIYDFIQWRRYEQEHRRDSMSKRHEPEKLDRQTLVIPPGLPENWTQEEVEFVGSQLSYEQRVAWDNLVLWRRTEALEAEQRARVVRSTEEQSLDLPGGDRAGTGTET